MILRKAQFEDSKDILEWRNDPLSRLMSLDESAISDLDHEKWFSQSLKDPDRILLLGVLDDQKVGICRFDLKPNRLEAEISINLNPLMRGKKLASLFLSLAIQSFRKDYNAKLIARIKNENLASQKIFAQCGFQLFSVDKGVLTFELR